MVYWDGQKFRSKDPRKSISVNWSIVQTNNNYDQGAYQRYRPSDNRRRARPTTMANNNSAGPRSKSSLEMWSMWDGDGMRKVSNVLWSSDHKWMTLETPEWIWKFEFWSGGSRGETRKISVRTPTRLINRVKVRQDNCLGASIRSERGGARVSTGWPGQRRTTGGLGVKVFREMIDHGGKWANDGSSWGNRLGGESGAVRRISLEGVHWLNDISSW
jgi:hypothetical protein